MFKNKKAYVHHIGGGLIVGFIIGAVLMYLIAKGIILASWNICGCP